MSSLPWVRSDSTLTTLCAETRRTLLMPEDGTLPLPSDTYRLATTTVPSEFAVLRHQKCSTRTQYSGDSRAQHHDENGLAVLEWLYLSYQLIRPCGRAEDRVDDLIR
jgi:hypothetical protein